MFNSKSISLLLASFGGLRTSSAQLAPYYSPPAGLVGAPVLATAPYPNTTIAGYTVIDTPIVRLAQEYARNHSSEAVFKHQMRAWLFGSLIVNNNETYRNTVDLEIQAVGALLHDLGWDMSEGSVVVSADKRFEVDGAIASRGFLEMYGDENWDQRRTQLVWDAIALHTTRTIGYYKENEVGVVSMGISVDYDGLRAEVSQEDFDAITTAYPNDDLKVATNETFTWLCATKPAATYDNQLQPWGERYVPDYNTTGHLRIDTIFVNL
ncbi:hypothetical protein F4778DRAFT_782986 [Xylariomycetidae sp. FL2044]|nr:hypothetical protein F4778DRAFT_782986 [Xylariomycetidae sp. FL2044]